MSAECLIHPLSDHLRLEKVFADCFYTRFNTRLVGGADEPFYQARKNGANALIWYRSDYRSSALHEVAHWCVAGAERRKQDDYGYWYAADGRDIELQKEFERVEVKPQALELLFTAACGWPFRVSVDNLALSDYNSETFAERVLVAALGLLEKEQLNERANVFIQALLQEFSKGGVLDKTVILLSFNN